MNQTVHDLTVLGKIYFSDGGLFDGTKIASLANIAAFERNNQLNTTALLQDDLIVNKKITLGESVITPTLLVDAIKFNNNLDEVQSSSFTESLKNVITNNQSKIDSLIPEIIDPPAKRIKLDNSNYIISMTPSLIDIGNYVGDNLQLNNTTIKFMSSGVLKSYFSDGLLRVQGTGSNNSTITGSDMTSTNGASTSSIGATGLTVPGGFVTGDSNIVTVSGTNQINFRTSGTDKIQVRTSDVALSNPISFLSTSASNRVITNVSTITLKDIQNSASNNASITYDTTLPSGSAGITYTAPNASSTHNFRTVDASSVTSTPLTITSTSTAIGGNLLVRMKDTTTPEERLSIALRKEGTNLMVDFVPRSTNSSSSGNLSLCATLKTGTSTWDQREIATVNYFGMFFRSTLNFTYENGSQPFVTNFNSTSATAIQKLGAVGTYTNLGKVLSSSSSVQSLWSFTLVSAGTYLINWNLKIIAQTTTISSFTSCRFGISTDASNSIQTQNTTSTAIVDLTNILASLSATNAHEQGTSCIVSVGANALIYFAALVTYASGGQLNTSGVVTYTRIG